MKILLDKYLESNQLIIINMYHIYHCIKINNNQYDIKKDISLLNKYIDRFKLNYCGKQKEYWLNNVFITISDNIRDFKYIKDDNIDYDENHNLLIQEFTFEKCNPYNFYQSDIEEIYDFYQSKINDINIFLKKYDNYFTVIFETNDLANFYNNDIFYI
jgi:hypothetical protein